MSLKFTAHTYSGDPVEMELLRDGTIIVLSHDLEYEMAFKAMGGDSEVLECYEDIETKPMRAFEQAGLPTSKIIAILVEIIRDYINRFWTEEVVQVVTDAVEYPPATKSVILERLDAILDVKPEGNDIKFEWLEICRQHMEKNADRLASRRLRLLSHRTHDILGSAMRFYDSLATLCAITRQQGNSVVDSVIFLDTTSFISACTHMALAATLIGESYAEYKMEHYRQIGIAFRVLGME